MSTDATPPFLPDLDLIENVGSGGMATVWKAYDKNRPEIVAVKLLNKEFTTKRADLESFVAEEKAMEKIDHPGIVKSYSYRMVPFLLADHPELSGTETITLSRQMMNGHKWNAFVLDLSFLGWHILSILTLGLLGIFFVNPYQLSTDAELYRVLSAKE